MGQNSNEIDWKAFGLNAGTNAINGLISLGTSWIDNEQKRKISRELAEHSFLLNEQAAENALARQDAWYQQYESPEAKVEQFRKAGLNPVAMLQGMNGTSGAGGIQGKGAVPVAQQMTGIADFYTKMRLARAQEKALESQANLNNAEAKNKPIEGELTIAKIAEAYANADNKKAQAAIYKWDEKISEINWRIATATEMSNINKAIDEANYVFEQSLYIQYLRKGQELTNLYDKTTFEQRVKNLSQEYNESVIKCAKMQMETEFTEEQMNNLAEYLALERQKVNLQGQSIENQKKFYEAQVEQWLTQNGFTQQQIKNEKTKIWSSFAANVYGSTCNLAGDIVKAVAPK